MSQPPPLSPDLKTEPPPAATRRRGPVERLIRGVAIGVILGAIIGAGEGAGLALLGPGYVGRGARQFSLAPFVSLMAGQALVFAVLGGALVGLSQLIFGKRTVPVKERKP
jgi:hypothetical protein